MNDLKGTMNDSTLTRMQETVKGTMNKPNARHTSKRKQKKSQHTVTTIKGTMKGKMKGTMNKT